MSRILVFIVAAALSIQAASLFAQDQDEPSIKSVLDAARAKYWQDKGSDAESGSASEAESPDSGEAAPEAAEAGNGASYTPVLLSFVPGLSVPFGYYDVSFAGGAVGTMTRDVSGAECSGVFNIARDLSGLQGAGVFNLARQVRGCQGAGVFNIADGSVSGFQGAGVFNIAHGEVLGLQGAGVFNIAESVRGPFQGAGVFNIARGIRGFQAAGVFNIADSVSGGQAAGVFNGAKRVSGVQIGLVNVAEHIDGVQLGLINIAGNGVDSLGLTYEPQTGFAYLHWQAGTPALYTVAALGAASGDWFNDFSGFVVSYGLGSRGRLFGFNIDLDVSAEQAISALPYQSFDASGDWSKWEGWERIRPYPAIRLMAGLPIGRHLQAVAGMKADIDFDSLGDRVPQALKAGEGWSGRVFGESFTAYCKWFFGFKI